MVTYLYVVTYLVTYLVRTHSRWWVTGPPTRVIATKAHESVRVGVPTW
jgi:hypothetical protein